MRIPSIAGLADAFIAAFRRFPVPMLAAVLGSFLMITYIQIENDYEHTGIEWMIRCILVCVLGLPLMTAIGAFSETRNWTDWRKWALMAVGAVLLSVYYFTVNLDYIEERDSFRFPGLFAVVHLLVAFAPYLNRLGVADFWEYNKRLFTNLIIGGFYSFILWIGLSGAILAVDQLFDVHINGRIYPQLFFLLTGVFNTTFFLFHFPKNYIYDHDDQVEPTFQVLGKYILIPISLLYLFILYAFTAKIILRWELPHGWVSSLIIGFATVGVFTWLLNFMPARKLGGVPFGLFSNWFWPILTPMLILLFVGVGRSISDYGVTNERFIVVHLGVWLLLNALYFIISKKDNIKFIPVSLALFVITALFGPLSMFSVSNRSQTKELKSLLEQSGRWEGDMARPSEQAVPSEDHARISSILYYLNQHNDYATDKPEWLSSMPDSFLESRYERAIRMMEWLKVKSIDSKDDTKHYAVYSDLFTNMTIPAGFNQLLALNTNWNEPQNRQDQTFIQLDTTGTFLVVSRKTGSEKPEVVDRFYVVPTLKAWSALEKFELKGDDRFIRIRGAHAEMLIILDRADFTSKEDQFILEGINGQVLLKPGK